MRRYIYALFVTLFLCPMTWAQSTDHNYVKTVTYLDREGSDCMTSVQYYDGLGRPDQQVVSGANTSGKNLYTYTEYDGSGRAVKSWAPVVGETSLGYMSCADIAIKSQSAYSDSKGYSQTTYDALDRPLFVSTPGEAWYENHKGKTTEYCTNGAKEVRLITPNTLQNTKTYHAAGTLYGTRTMDEDGITTLTFKDMLGRVILERRGNEAPYADTYYVYNELNQLVYVLPPMYNEGPTVAKIALYAYQYSYDNRGRMISKTLPGCQPITYEYDNADRVTKMTDGVLADSCKYRGYTYDRLGRLKTQSIYCNRDIKLYDEIVNYYDCDAYIDSLTQTLVVVDTAYHNGIGKITATRQRASNGEEIQTTFTYDEYGRVVKQEELGLGRDLTVKNYAYNFIGDKIQETTSIYQLHNGRYTLLQKTSIDNKFEYPHTKLLSSSLITIEDGSGTIVRIDTLSRLTYDQLGHVISNDRSGRAGDMAYQYDLLHGWVKKISTPQESFEQTLYRETGSQTPRWNGSISAMSWKTADDYMRRYDYDYDELNRLTSADYSYYRVGRTSNGSLTMSLIPSVGGDNEDYSVDYWYDKNSNLTSIYRQGRMDLSSGEPVYDTLEDDEIERNGNQLKKYDPYRSGGDPYYGNFDFENSVDEDVEYSYDKNGNLIEDLNKGLTYAYDLLGHPLKVTYGQNSIEYVYAADGRRLSAEHKLLRNGQLLTDKTDYVDALILKNGTPSMYRFAGGYYSYDTHGVLSDCHLYVQDYQGSNRMVVNARTNATEQQTHYYPYGELISDISTGSDHQQFKYGGKELDRTFGLDLFDFHARQQDAKLACFNAIDPLAEKYYGISPYAYCAGDPVNCVDPDGRDIFVLSAPNGAHGAGHMAMLVQETRENGKKQWYLYSKNGTDENFGIRGVSSGDNVGTGSNLSSGWDTIDDFFNDTNLNPIDENGKPEYQEGFLLKCDETKDQLAIEGAKSVLGESDNNKDYDVLNNNCAQTVQAGVSRAGFKDGSGTKGRRIAARVVGRAVGSFLGYKYGEALGDYVGQTAYEKSPNLIYKRMKEQNKVEDKDVKKYERK